MSDAKSPAAAVDDTADKYERLLSRFATTAFPPLIIAVGLDERLLQALDRAGAATRVLAIEPIPSAAAQLAAQRTCRAWIDSQRLTVLTGPDYRGAADAWRLIAPDAPTPPMIVDPTLPARFPAESDRAKAIARQVVRGARANEEARRQFAGGYLLNTLSNIPVIASEGDVSALTNLFANVPAIVIGAGPSLDANLAALKELCDRALLVSVDTAVRPLLAAGIHPHLVVSADPSDTNARHLNDLPDVRGMWFVAEGSLAPSVFPQFTGRTFVFKVSDHEPWPWLAEHGAGREQLNTWGSVLTAGFDLALRAGCNPIVFAGADLAYSAGLQYCRNTAFEPDWEQFPTDAERAAEFAKYLLNRPHLAQPDVNGCEVTTAPHFVQFRDWIVAQANAAVSRLIINATGGGILHGGRVNLGDLSDLKLPTPAHSRDSLQRRLADAWTASTSNHVAVRQELARSLSYGAPVPLERWDDFTRRSATLEQIRSRLQSANSRLDFDRRKMEYLAWHRDSYDRRIATLTDAQELSHGYHDEAARKACAQQTHVMLDFLERTYRINRPGVAQVLDAMSEPRTGLRALDVGCGAGRSMEAMIDAGVHVDGVDISERMIHFARANPKLANAAFFVSRGNDCGAAPDGAYDIVYSQLCFRYVRSRTVRNELLRAMARALRPGGVVYLEMRFFPDDRATSIPAPHVPWSADHLETEVEAGQGDVRPTPDELGLVYEDFSRVFQDVRLQFVTMLLEYRQTLPPYLMLSGSTEGNLWSRVNTDSFAASSTVRTSDAHYAA